MTTAPLARTSRFPDFESLGEADGLMPRIEEIIDRITLFEGFDRSDVVGIARHMQVFRAPAGRELIREGDPGEFMLLVLQGSIEIVKLGASGLPHRIAIVTAGESLGEMSLVDGEPRFASCLSLEETVFAVLERDALDIIFDNEPHLGIKLMRELLKLLNQRLRDTGWHLVEALEH